MTNYLKTMIALLLFVPVPTAAADSLFSVSPTRLVRQMNAGASLDLSFSLTNGSDQPLTFVITAEDIAAGDELMPVELLGTENGQYSLKNWISATENVITLAAGESRVISANVNVPESSFDGGYYGALVISTARPAAISGGAQTRFISRVAVPVLLTVGNDLNHSGVLASLKTSDGSNVISDKGVTLFALFENTGDVHLAPYGSFKISNVLGQDVYRQEIEPWIVLPNSQRTRVIDVRDGLLFGPYTASIAMARGYDSWVDQFEVTFWVLPWKSILAGAIAGVAFVSYLTMKQKNLTVNQVVADLS